MNRTLRKGCIGLAVNWMQRAVQCSTKEAHDDFKLIVSSAGSLGERQMARLEFASLTGDGHPSRDIIARVLDHEKDLRGGDAEEPAWLQCPPTAAQRALYSR